MLSDPACSDAVVFALVRHLFHCYLYEHELDTEQAESVPLNNFYLWMRRQIIGECVIVESFPDYELILSNGFTDEDVRRTLTAVSSPLTFVPVLQRWWPLLTLASRRPPTSAVSAVVFTASVVYVDGSQALLNRTVDLSRTKCTDGALVTLLRELSDEIAHDASRLGIDGIYRAVQKRLPVSKRDDVTPFTVTGATADGYKLD